MPAERQTVLVVEDLPANLDLLYQVLGGEYRVLCATRGQRGFEIALARKPDIILLDVMLPDMDGYEVCARLKADPATQPIPVIFVTAMGEETDEEYGLSLGAVDYITKPFRPWVVRARVRNHLDAIRMQERILQARKLESLGSMAAGVAHRLNNLLAAILGQSGLAAMKLPEVSPSRAHLQRLDEAVERAADLARQMLACAGKGHPACEPADLSRLIAEMWAFLDAGTPRNLTLERELAEGLPPVDIDASQVRTILLNLVTNAAEAAPGGGTVTLSTGLYEPPVPGPAGASREAGVAPPCRVFLRVADTGCGMDQETLRRAFDPFFTTKFMGRGLGLAAVRGMVAAHGGFVDARSEPGRGSVLTLVFPCAVQPAA